MNEFDQTTDPYYLGPSNEELESLVDRLRTDETELRALVNLTSYPEWAVFIEVVEQRKQEVLGSLARAPDWETACRLQGALVAWNWLLGFADTQKVGLEAVYEMLQGYSERLEGPTHE